MPRASREDALFAEIAMRHGLLEQEQIDRAFEILERGRRAQTLGDVVRRKKWLSRLRRCIGRWSFAGSGSPASSMGASR